MSKITFEVDDAIALAGKLNALPALEIAAGKELVDAFLNRVETISRFNRIASVIRFGMRIGMEAALIEVDEETLTWICVMLEESEGVEW